MLLGTAAAAIPIALHFFFRSRYRTVPWAAMKFLLTSIEQTSRRLRFQELLLLLARVLVLVLLALALARPLSTGGGAGGGEAVDAVLVIDTSFSMGADDGAVNRLQRAQTAALKVIDQLPPHSTVQIVTCADRATLVGPRSPARLDQARSLIAKLELTSLATDLYPGVVEAAEVLKRGQATNKELYLFSDLQRQGFEHQAGALKERLQSIHDQATVYLVRCGTRQLKNVALVGITPQSGVPRPGERVGFAVLVRNTGSEAVRDLEVTLTVDADPNKRETQALPVIGGGETRAVTLTAQLEKPGRRVLTATVKHDDLAGDNRFDQVILVRDQVNVLVVDGSLDEREPSKSSSYFLVHALVPVQESARAKYFLQPRLVSPRFAAPALLGKQDLCILVNVSLQPDLKRRAESVPADFLAELERFVRQGKGLLVFAGDNVAAEPYNRLLGQKHDLLPAQIAGFLEQPAKSPLLINRDSIALPALWKFKEDDYYKDFGRIEVWRALDVQAKEGGHVGLRYSNGKPALLSRRVDAGEVVLVTTAADPSFQTGAGYPAWTDWPLRLGMYVPFVDVLVSQLLHNQTQNHNLVAGQTLAWYPSEKKPQAFTLINPDGTEKRLGEPEMVDGRLVVTASELPRAGIYRLATTAPLPAGQAAPEESTARKDEAFPLAVTPDLRESADLETLSDQQLDERLGFAAIHVTAGGNVTAFTGAERTGREWTLWLLLAVLLLACGEALLAWWCGQTW